MSEQRGGDMQRETVSAPIRSPGRRPAGGHLTASGATALRHRLSTSTPHRCRFLRVDAAQLPRIEEMTRNAHERLSEGRDRAWLG